MSKLSRISLWCASLATAGVALWLFWVIATVLPARDPAHVPLWRVVALCLLAYVGLSWAFLVWGTRMAWLRWLVLVLSVAAIGSGLYGIVGMFLRAQRGGDFEGYVVLMGLILFAHGSAAVVCAMLTGRSAQPASAALAAPPNPMA
jgi:hypothetical protein